MEKLKIRLTGVAPLVMHNIQLADPRYVRKSGIKAITSKRQKTEADELELMRLEYIAGLYWNDGPYLPGVNVEAAIAIAAGQLMKGGKKIAQGAVQCDDAPLSYGAKYKTPDDLFADERFLSYVPAVVPSTKARVMRARPMFPQWTADVTVHYHTLTEDQILQIAQRAGDVVGVCDWRPRNGRFSVEKV